MRQVRQLDIWDGAVGLIRNRIQESYQIDQQAYEPDLCIVDLNAELAACDACTASTMGESERRSGAIMHADKVSSHTASTGSYLADWAL